MPAGQLHAIIGDDDFLVRQRAKEIFDELAQAFPDELAREVVDGRADRVEEVARILGEVRSAAGTLSLFGGGKLVWLNEANFLNQTRVGAAQGSKDELDKTKDFLGSLGEGTGVVFSACPVHRNHAFVKWLQKNAKYEDVSKSEKGDLAFRRIVEETSRECGVAYAAGAVDMLAAKISGNARLGTEETRKLAAYLGDEGEEITEAK